MRTLSRLAIVGLALGATAGLATPASAAPGDPVPSQFQVIQPTNTKNTLVPTGSNAGARIVAKPRIGTNRDTPDNQTWTFDRAKKFDAAGKVIKGGIAFVFQPTFGRAGVRALCMDVVGDSKSAGAAIELRACDGTPSQTFTFVGDLQFPLVRNALSGLQLEVKANGAVVQEGGIATPAGASAEEKKALQARRNAQFFTPRPREIGVGGA